MYADEEEKKRTPASPPERGASKGAWLAFAAVALLAAVPPLTIGFFHDDYIHRVALSGAEPWYARGPADLYAFLDPSDVDAMRARGVLPYWTDPQLKVRFFRPLSSLTLAADIWLAPRAPLVGHLHSLLWYALLVGAAIALFRGSLGPRAALFASFAYALASAHLTPLGWIAARHTVVSAALGLSAVALHVRGRERGSRAARLAAPLVLGVSFLAGEMTVAAAGLLFFYELTRKGEPLATRALAFLPHGTIVLAHLAFYVTSGHGTAHVGVYANPFEDPVAFVSSVTTRVPALVAELTLSAPSILTWAPPVSVAFVALGVVGAAWLAIALRRAWSRFDERERAFLRFAIAGGLAGLLPVSSGPIDGRLASFALLGSAASLGLLVDRTFARGPLGAPVLGRDKVLVGALLGVNLLFIVVARGVMPFGLASVTREGLRVARDADIGCDGDAVIFEAGDAAVGVYLVPTIAWLGGELPERFLALSMAQQSHRIENVTATGFELVVLGERQTNLWELVHRDAPLARGDVLTLDRFEARVLEATDAGPTRIAFDFARPLDSPDLCFYVFRDGNVHAAEPPRLGETRELPHFAGPGSR